MVIAPDQTIHASCVAIGGRAVLIEGPSGGGKSDLALRLIDRGATLVSDDYTVVTPDDGALMARPPATIAGRIEVRGVGIVTMPWLASAPVGLLVTIADQVERLPLDPASRVVAGRALPVMAVEAFHASAPIKVEIALSRIAVPT